MDQGETWIVRIHNDDMNTFGGVTLVLEELLAEPIEECWGAAERIHRSGWVDLEPMAGTRAEQLVAALQVRGLHAKLRRA